jgi:hypothetical protein
MAARQRFAQFLAARRGILLISLLIFAASAQGCRGSAIGTSSEPLGGPVLTFPDGGMDGDAVSPTCLTDVDCAPLAKSPCTLAICEPVSRRCVTVPRPEFAACTSTDLCVAEAVCFGGTCQPLTPRTCDDGNPCTIDACDSAIGCTALPADATVACSDDNPCTLGDHCQAGSCTSVLNTCSCDLASDCTATLADPCAAPMQCSGGFCVPLPDSVTSCDDKNPCTIDTCDSQVGGCIHAERADGLACDDGSICTQGDVCLSGSCVSAGKLPCAEAPGACPTTCDPAVGCSADATPTTGPCDDGDDTTTGDQCLQGACVGQPTGKCLTDADCPPAADCLGKPVCRLGLCMIDTDLAVGCPADPTQTCVLPVCTATGCQTYAAAKGAPCQDGSQCTHGDQCSANGGCMPGPELNCDDADPCTYDVCDATVGCKATPAAGGTACQDGDPCTTGDTCGDGSCVAGPHVCDDGEPCTTDLCDPAKNNACSHLDAVEGSGCEDGNPCTVGGACQAGVCVGGIKLVCDDGSPCTKDACTEQGTCSHEPIDAPDGQVACDDGDSCTSADKCTAGKCEGVSGVCQCGKDSDCQGFEDANLCNGTLRCINHACEVDPGTLVECPAPSSACAAVQCQPSTGQCFEVSMPGAPCDDGDICSTQDTCLSGGVCVGGPPVLCTDGDLCTVDSCDPNKGCTFVVGVGVSAPCDDGNACTFGDKCGANGCESGINACQCQTDGDCQAFDDGNVCNGGLLCKQGLCVADGKGVTCPDPGGPCTPTACDPKTGQCLSTALLDGSACEIAATCATGGICKGGECLGAQVASCDDQNPCTKDSCTLDGCQHAVQQGLSCSDGNACTANETCGATGTCGGGTNVCNCQLDIDCPDDGDKCNGVFECKGGFCQPKSGSVVQCDATQNTPCSVNTCQPTTGQCAPVVTADGQKCDDGDQCSLGDACLAGKCKAGAGLACDDQNPCTDDGCNPAQGCWHQANTKTCDDGNQCTVGDVCASGKCQSGLGSCDCQIDQDCVAKDDGNACNGVVKCQQGLCKLDATTIVTCDASLNTSCKVNACMPASGKCALTNVPDLTGCDDQSACTQTDRCVAGQCVGNAVACDDGNSCTADSCDAKLGCVSKPSAGTCDDGDACTKPDTCQAGVCKAGPNTCPVCTKDADCPDDGNLCNGLQYCGPAGVCAAKPGTTVVCGAGNACNANTCQPNTGKCVLVPVTNGSPCDDATVCSATSSCFGGACVGANLVDCNDQNACSADACDPVKGCTHTATGATCDDGNACTVGDLCTPDLKCLPGANKCACQLDSDCKNDADLCNGTLICSGNQCVVKPGSVIACPPGGIPCLVGTCTPATGQCGVQLLPDGAACDDGTACSTGEKCNSGKCIGSQLVCNDKNPCTKDSCDAKLGCVTTPAPGACDDGNACTVGDACQNGACQPGANTCQCQTAADCAAFEDGNVCNGKLTCLAGKCAVDPATVVVCADDGLSCTAATCNPLNGQCTQAPATNGTPCGGAELCGGSGTCQTGKCTGTSGCADDGNPCTTTICDGKGTCGTQPAVATCEDGDACTVGDACQAGKCVAGTNTCACKTNVDCVGYDDGNLCNGVFTCQVGQCKLDPKTIVTCVPGANTCVTPVCLAATGQCQDQSAPNGTPCDDGNACTTSGQCASGQCLVQKVTCNDNNGCTTDSCDTVVGCKYANVPQFPPTTCDDGDPCTVISACNAGKCQGLLNTCFCGSDADCKDDGNLCNGISTCQGGTCKTKAGSVITCSTTGDTACLKNQCVPATGACVKAPSAAGTACDDANLCTGGDVCSLGNCIGVPFDCADAVNCTVDACVPAQGCIHTPNNTACADASVCTEDICDATAGCMSSAKPGLPCDDGDACTAGEKCLVLSGGVQCGGGATVDCNDLNPCTADSCQKTTGCAHAPQVGATCDDGNVCTSGDACGATGKCEGKASTCDDNNLCTTDACSAATGCTHVANNAVCDDGNVCTKGDTCQATKCVGAAVSCDDGNPCTQDVCTTGVGCQSSPVAAGTACNDGNACTSPDTCAAGKCTGPAKTCDDANPCTSDACDAVTGACVTKPLPGGACNDADACTSLDVCQASGKCAGQVKDCTDANTCSVDSCQSATGNCLHTPSPGATCDDGQPCTAPDLCSAAATCIGSPKVCDDAKACTTDKCDAATGQCLFTAIPGITKNFEDGSTSGWAFQSLNQQIQWTLDKLKSSSPSVSLYVGHIVPATQQHTYDVGPGLATATLSNIVIPAGVQNAKLTVQVWFDRDPNQAAGCNNLSDRVGVLVNSQIATQLCVRTTAFQLLTVDLQAYAGQTISIGLTFAHNMQNNNGQGAWFDDLAVTWTCP